MQVYNLPSGFRSEKLAIGGFIESDSKNFDGPSGRDYVGIRVHIDIRQPLKPSTKLKRSGGEWLLIGSFLWWMTLAAWDGVDLGSVVAEAWWDY